MSMLDAAYRRLFSHRLLLQELLRVACTAPFSTAGLLAD